MRLLPSLLTPSFFLRLVLLRFLFFFFLKNQKGKKKRGRRKSCCILSSRVFLLMFTGIFSSSFFSSPLSLLSFGVVSGKITREIARARAFDSFPINYPPTSIQTLLCIDRSSLSLDELNWWSIQYLKNLLCRFVFFVFFSLAHLNPFSHMRFVLFEYVLIWRNIYSNIDTSNRCKWIEFCLFLEDLCGFDKWERARVCVCVCLAFIQKNVKSITIGLIHWNSMYTHSMENERERS